MYPWRRWAQMVVHSTSYVRNRQRLLTNALRLSSSNVASVDILCLVGVITEN